MSDTKDFSDKTLSEVVVRRTSDKPTLTAKMDQVQKQLRRIKVFFYGTFMDPTVLAEYGVITDVTVPAKVSGFELRIQPRVNLVPCEEACVYGTVSSVTHDDLEKIYSNLERNFGLKYLPEAVLAELLQAVPQFEPALCYIASHMTPGPASPDYVKELAECVRALNFPESYAKHIESFGGH